MFFRTQNPVKSSSMKADNLQKASPYLHVLAVTKEAGFLVISSALHAEGPGFKPQWNHVLGKHKG